MFPYIFVLMCLFVSPLIIALFIPKKYVLRREAIIQRSTSEVFDYVKMLKNQEYFSKWVMTDPDLNPSYVGVDGQIGAKQAWKSQLKGVGKGVQEIKKIVTDENQGGEIQFEIKFEKPFKSTSQSAIIVERIAVDQTKNEQTNKEQTKVTWEFSGNMVYPMNIMLLVISMEKILGGDIATSLGTLKKVLEN